MRNRIMSVGASAVLALAVGGCSCFQKHHEEGKTSEMVVPADSVPQPARDAFAREFPGATIKKVEKETYKNGDVHYEFNYSDKAGKSGEVEYDAGGKRMHED